MLLQYLAISLSVDSLSFSSEATSISGVTLENAKVWRVQVDQQRLYKWRSVWASVLASVAWLACLWNYKHLLLGAHTFGCFQGIEHVIWGPGRAGREGLDLGANNLDFYLTRSATI